MIDRVKIQNYKSLKDVEVTFDSRLTVLVGENGSGKSSVLRCIKLLSDLAGVPWQFNDVIQGLQNGLAQTLSTSDSMHQYFSLSIKQDLQNLLICEYIPVGPSNNQSKAWSVKLQVGADNYKRDSSYSEFHKANWELGLAEIVRLEASELAKPTAMPNAYIDQPMPADGKLLASYLDSMSDTDPAAFSALVDHFCKLIPQIRGIRTRRARVSGSDWAGDEIIFDLPNRKGVPASQMSDGTLYALGLIVKILDPQRPKTLLIDDIDHGFHPKAQIELVELIKKLLDEFPDLQIIATSHSPYILSGLDWNQVRVLHLRDDGTTVIRPLTDHPNYAKWGGSMNPGEFWSHAGEEWADIKPAPKSSSKAPEMVAS